jgi:hypothetical protein
MKNIKRSNGLKIIRDNAHTLQIKVFYVSTHSATSTVVTGSVTPV